MPRCSKSFRKVSAVFVSFDYKSVIERIYLRCTSVAVLVSNGLDPTSSGNSHITALKAQIKPHHWHLSRTSNFLYCIMKLIIQYNLTPPKSNEDALEVIYRAAFKEVRPPLFIIHRQLAGIEEGRQGGGQRGGVHNSCSLCSIAILQYSNLENGSIAVLHMERSMGVFTTLAVSLCSIAICYRLEHSTIVKGYLESR